MKIEDGTEVTLLEHPCYKKQIFRVIRYSPGMNYALIASARLGHVFYWPIDKMQEKK